MNKFNKNLKVTKDIKCPEDDTDIVTLLPPPDTSLSTCDSATDISLYSKMPDPVRLAKRRENRKTRGVEPPALLSSHETLDPSVSVRLDLERKAILDDGPKKKYVPPEKKEWKKAKEEKKKEFLEELNHCEYDVFKVTSLKSQQVDIKLNVSSPYVSMAKVVPRKPSYDKDAAYPDPQSEEELKVHKPKSGIFINVTRSECLNEDLPKIKKKKKKQKKKKEKDVSDVFKTYMYEGEGEGEWFDEDMFFEDEGEEAERKPSKTTQMSTDMLLTKYRRKVSTMSASTEVNKGDLVAENLSWDQIPVISKVVQTIRLDQQACKQTKKLKRWTLESHSFTKLKQPILEKFCFKAVVGTIHQGDQNFSELSRGKQGICMSIAAYCFSKIKLAKNWNSMTVDDVVELGDKLYNDSVATLHMHTRVKELKPKELQKFVIIDDKKIRYQIQDPEIVGHVRSTDKRIFNLTKGLRIFFNRCHSGILTTHQLVVVMWRQNKKYTYMFDATPRAKDLYQDPKGTAVLAKFKTISGIATILLDRTELGNSPFSISEIVVTKIGAKDDVDEDVPVDETSQYNIIDENKAVVKATFDLSDKCFGFNRNKQAMTMACVALVYSRITPPNSWHRKTLDKIMIIGNQLLTECQKVDNWKRRNSPESRTSDDRSEMTLENMPALFTVGPYIVNIYIFANRFVDVLFKKGQNCLLKAYDEFFQTSTNSILEIGKNTLAVWNQRNMFYMFDPYSRNIEALTCRSGTACVSMYSDLKALCETITKNFPEPDLLFRIHPLKVIKITRDNTLSKTFPKTMQMNDFPVETFKCQKMRKSRKKAVEKPITVHQTGCAMRKLLAGESPGASLISIASNVGSITADIFPRLPCLSHKPVPKTKIAEMGVIADLDSPSLSDTQIEPPRPKPFGDEEMGLMDLDSFKLTEEEKEMLDKGEGEGAEGLMGEGGMKGEGEGQSYMALNQGIQVRSGSLAPCFISALTNTDVSYKYKILPALEYPPKYKKQEDKPGLDLECQKKAFENVRNYVDYNGIYQVVTGSQNIYDYSDHDVAHDVAVYVAILAITLSEEFPPSKWRSKTVDYILRAGNELYSQHKTSYNKIEEFRIKFIYHEYRVTVENIFDTFLGRDVFTNFQGFKMIEGYVDNELFDNNCYGIIITPKYVLAIILYNNLFYIFEPYSCNKDGTNKVDVDGVACVQRFKSLEALVLRVINNRVALMKEDAPEYTRLVLVRPTVERINKKPPDVKSDEEEEAKEVELTQSMELAKESNFDTLPDNTEIVRGHVNVSKYGKDIEYMAPFVCIMASVVGQKYNVLTWSPAVVDFVIKCGAELYKESSVRFDQVPKLEIPKVSLGTSDYSISVSYLYDALMMQSTLEQALNKILHQDCDWAIIVTQNYSCAVFYHNFLYYMLDCFGCNEVGLGEGHSNTGVGCLGRFKDLHAMANRIMFNKGKREVQDQLEYTRFVVSLCKVKRILKVEKKKKRKGAQDTDEETDVESEEGDRKRQKMDEGGKKSERKRDERNQGSKKREDGGKSEGQREEGKREGGKREGEKRDEGRTREDVNTPKSKKREKTPEGKSVQDGKHKNIVGYQFLDRRYILEGSKVLSDRAAVSGSLKSDHFVSLCACLMVINYPIRKWDTRRVDTVMEMGQHIFSHATNLQVSPKRTVKNILMGRYLFDVVIRKIDIPSWRKNRNIDVGLTTVMNKRKYCILQFPNCSYVVYKDEDGYHLFDPYGPPPPPKKKNSSEQKEEPKAGWVKFKNDHQMKKHVVRNVTKGSESYMFYTFSVLNIRKASKKALISHRLALHEAMPPGEHDLVGKPFFEQQSWLEVHQSPWARLKEESASGQTRGDPEAMWHDWDVEFPDDLFSLVGTLHQISKKFKMKTRGKQTLANLLVAIAMTNIYDFPEWNSHVMDSILINGDEYFKKCIQDITKENYEISVNDLISDCTIFPYSFQVNFAPIVQGTMFLDNPKKFNLYKALRSFFDNYESRCGIISAMKGECKRCVAFGKMQEAEYFMYDCQAFGPPMFWDRQGVGYALRCLSLNRLLHCLVLTLRGGDFFIYDVETYNYRPVD